MICKHMHIMNLNECKSLKSIRGPTSLGIHPPKELVQQPIFTSVSSSFDYFSLPVVLKHATHFYKRVNILMSLLFTIWWLSTLTLNTNPDCLTVLAGSQAWSPRDLPKLQPPSLPQLPSPTHGHISALLEEKRLFINSHADLILQGLKICFKF